MRTLPKVHSSKKRKNEKRAIEGGYSRSKRARGGGFTVFYCGGGLSRK